MTREGITGEESYILDIFVWCKEINIKAKEDTNDSHATNFLETLPIFFDISVQDSRNCCSFAYHLRVVIMPFFWFGVSLFTYYILLYLNRNMVKTKISIASKENMNRIFFARLIINKDNFLNTQPFEI